MTDVTATVVRAAGLTPPKYRVWWCIQYSHPTITIESEPEEIVTEDVPRTLSRIARRTEMFVDFEPGTVWRHAQKTHAWPCDRGHFWHDRFDIRDEVDGGHTRLSLLVEIWTEPEAKTALDHVLAGEWEVE